MILLCLMKTESSGDEDSFGLPKMAGAEKAFHRKQDRMDRQGRAVGYKNGLKLNDDLATSISWSVYQIDSRTEKLVHQVTKLFKLQGGDA